MLLEGEGCACMHTCIGGTALVHVRVVVPPPRRLSRNARQGPGARGHAGSASCQANFNFCMKHSRIHGHCAQMADITGAASAGKNNITS